MKKIMFVDDEARVLQGLQRMLRTRRKEWDMEFVEGGAAALQRLAEDNFHVVVTDMRMPVMDGAALLEKVRNISPATVRIVLSGHSEKTSILRSVRPAHQYLSKPVEKETLEEAIENALSLHDLLTDQGLATLLAKLESLPALPRIFQELLAEMESEDCSLKRVGDIIASDMGMTATTLKLVNSAFFGMPRKVGDPGQAVGLLGLETVKALALTYQLFSVQESNPTRNFSLEQLWSHSLNTGGFTRAIAQCENWGKEDVEEAFLAGMLHDVGKLTLMTAAGDKYLQVLERVRQGDGLLHEVEKKMMDTTHAEVGAYLLGLWGLQSTVIQGIGRHHHPRPSASGRPDLVTLVHAANVFEHELVVINPKYGKPELDLAYLEALGATGRVGEWRKACLEITSKGGVYDGGHPA